MSTLDDCSRTDGARAPADSLSRAGTGPRESSAGGVAGTVRGEGGPADPAPVHYVSRPAGSARVLVYSQRNAERNRALVMQYEFEDVICELDAVRMLSPRGRAMSEVSTLGFRIWNAGRTLLDLRKRPLVVPEPLPDDSHDLFFGVFQAPWHLRHLDSMPGWHERAGRRVCWLIEAWSRELPLYARYLRLLDRFDHVFCFNSSAIPVLQRYTRAPVEFLPAATDAIRFCPWPARAPRVIDVLSYGRRSPPAHEALLELARRQGLYYVYDTVDGTGIPRHREHRELLASQLRRSRYAISYGVLANRGVRTGGEDALTARYFEVAASGAIMLGSASRSRDWDENFDWPDALFEVPYAPDDMAALLRTLESDPERLERARRRSVLESLRRHDWLHRWRRVLEVAGLEPTPEMGARAERLRALARLVDSDGLPAAAAAPPASTGVTRVGATGPVAVAAPRVEPWQSSMFRRGGERRCPNCSEVSTADATSCRYCHERF